MTTTAVLAKQILFSPAMVRAILDGRKVQTRRIVEPRPPARFRSGDVAAITNGTRWAISRIGSKKEAWPPGDRFTAAGVSGTRGHHARRSTCRCGCAGCSCRLRPSASSECRTLPRPTRSPKGCNVAIPRLDFVSVAETGQLASPRRVFAALWDSINGRGAWDRNDWVFAYTFGRVEKPEGWDEAARERLEAAR